MKKLLIMTLTTLSAAAFAAGGSDTPLLQPFDTPYGTPPFAKIKLEHYKPAIEASIDSARVEIKAIADNPAAPTFANTIEALERAGALLDRTASIFFNLDAAETSDQMQGIAMDISPMMTAFANDVTLDPKLFARVKAVYEQRDKLKLTAEQQMLLKDTYENFARSGAALPEKDKARFREISTELSQLSLKFGQNVLAETNDFTLHLSDPKQVEALPAFVRESMAEEAAAKGKEGWLVTLQYPSFVPFMTYSPDRELKQQLWMAYNSRAFHGNSSDNRLIVLRIANLRLEKARLLGFSNYADWALEDRMAENSSTVNSFLDNLLKKTMPYARKDLDMIGDYARKQGLEGDLKPWDWAYFDEKYKNEVFDLNSEQVKPYFKLENVQKGIFLLAEKLYGLQFKKNDSIPVYHPDVEAYEVSDSAGRFMAVLYMDFFPRASKRGGAWMTSFREMSRTADGKEVRPIISICGNFTKPTATSPSLLTFDEVNTTLHEFGHALHGILAEGTYKSKTGTNVYQDFVELPSQIMENWATEKEWLDLWAEHYQTGEKMPSELIDKIVASKNHLAAYAAARQLSFGILDMAWHSVTGPIKGEVDEFERRATAPARLFAPVDGTCTSVAFSHIFAGGYSAGYYSYKWAEVLEADAFSMFRERGIFDKATAASFRDNILSKGGSEHPMKLYEQFRGRKPDTQALFDKMGLK